MKSPNSASPSSPIRCGERDGQLRGTTNRLHLAEVHIQIERDLVIGRLASQFAAQLALAANDPVQPVEYMDGNPDRASLVRDSALDRLTDPPGRVRREFEALPPVEFLGCAHEPDRSLLNQIEERQTLVLVALGDGDDEPEVSFDQFARRLWIAGLDPLGEAHLIRCGQQIELADLAQERLQGLLRLRIGCRCRLCWAHGRWAHAPGSRLRHQGIDRSSRPPRIRCDGHTRRSRLALAIASAATTRNQCQRSTHVTTATSPHESRER